MLVDKNSLDFAKKFVPPANSQLAMAAYQNKNGFRITCRPFTVFKNPKMGGQAQNIFRCAQRRGGAQDDVHNSNMGKDIELSEDESAFKIHFVDFSQRRRVGFRGAFEFDNKRIMLASRNQIRILAYFQNVDAVGLENTLLEKKMEIR